MRWSFLFLSLFLLLPHDFSPAPEKISEVIITIDDFILTPDTMQTSQAILDYFNDTRVILFVIPAEMQAFDFPPNFEIAQHGFSHINPKDGSYEEFRGLPAAEIEQRISEGKRLLESMGYEVKGFRAPGYSLSQKDLPILRKYFEYDSSLWFYDDDFEIPCTFCEYSFYACNEKRCHPVMIAFYKAKFRLMHWINTQRGKPTVVLFHYWQLKEIIKNDKKYLSGFQ